MNVKNRTYFLKIALAFGVIVILRIFLAVAVPKGGMAEESAVLTSSTVREFFPGAAFIEKDEEFTCRLRVLGPGRGVLGYFIFTSPCADHIIGYAGPTPVFMAKTGDGIILEVRMLENSETPGFNNKVKSSGILEYFKGLHWREAAHKEVDAVTGATFTSTAVIGSIRHTLSMLDRPDAAEPREAGTFILKGGDFFTFLLIFAAFFTAVLHFKIKRVMRLAVLILSVFWLGFARAELLSIDLIARWAVRGILAGASFPLFFTAFLTVVTSILTGKSLYCYYICPFGALQEFAGNIFPLKARISPKLFVLLGKIKYLALIAIAGSVFIFPYGDLTQVEPFTAFAFSSASAMVFFIAGFSLVLSLFVRRFWCNFLCPTGAFFELFRRVDDRDLKHRKTAQGE